MYFAFIDESGNPDVNDVNSHFFVLSALVMQEKGFPFLNQGAKELKLRIWDILNDYNDVEIPSDFELHLKEITSKIKHFSTLWNDDEKVIRVLDEIYLYISNLYAKIITVVIPKVDFYKEYSDGMRTWAFKLLVERLNRYVRTPETSDREYVLMVMDSAGEEEDYKRRQEIEYFMQHGTNWSEYPEQVIETPFIGDSKLHNGVQLADAVVYLLRRHVRKCFNINPNSFLNQYTDIYMKQITPLFYLGPKIDNQNVIRFFPHTVNVPNSFWNVFL